VSKYYGLIPACSVASTLFETLSTSAIKRKKEEENVKKRNEKRKKL
jgi:hypothetical protein